MSVYIVSEWQVAGSMCTSALDSKRRSVSWTRSAHLRKTHMIVDTHAYSVGSNLRSTSKQVGHIPVKCAVVCGTRRSLLSSVTEEAKLPKNYLKLRLKRAVAATAATTRTESESQAPKRSHSRGSCSAQRSTYKVERDYCMSAQWGTSVANKVSTTLSRIFSQGAC